MKETMMDYIIETEAVCKSNLQHAKILIQPLMECFLEWEYEKILIVASGSSANAALCAKYFMQDTLYCDVEVISPYTFTHYTKYVDDKTFVFTISQSGLSTNTIDAIKKIQKLNRKAIVLTGDIHSDVASADVVIDYGVGKERVGYVTKGVSTLALYLCLFAIHASYQLEYISTKDVDGFHAQLSCIYDAYPQLITRAVDFYKRHQKALLSMSKLFICAVGPNIGVACEGALKISETVKIPAFAYEIEEYIHGPNLQLDPSYTVICIDTHDACSKRVQDIWRATTCITDHSFLVSRDMEGDTVYHYDLDVLPTLSPLIHVVFFQVLAYQITTDKNQWEDYILMKDFNKVVKSKTK
ncbi:MULTISPECIES: SIS domain-containing protein [unclassified Breznakia]|uniref:SIS domain-containing protein n=1 Tax=unclassified Breznakia TaxID=2623764 RepID=UPI0024764E31|nr:MULTISPECIES: SIS domain-containing protein [unclassified Breznakia]MDH6367953.1 glucoselysine-6-phosphate deglycase [Breznakia sp. PH1-1]MDH6405041.1 glucoselysine-6-phosphate deglycase [Breznakia sp. PF1-11]MDH6412756.1 glucoselysine-6-phosphate deglycase [Breznakia sp. PFB1-11]MDH6415107.1 glucoselysine-6-phosphate deglycase [Breznakia sp. PFB1-14]MDH6417427.1 glucoselysine-6-phosphate deglycase [Breznakia sp. PFB1-4]